MSELPPVAQMLEFDRQARNIVMDLSQDIDNGEQHKRCDSALQNRNELRDRLNACYEACAGIPHPEHVRELVEAVEAWVKANSTKPEGAKQVQAAFADAATAYGRILAVLPKLFDTETNQATA